MYVDWAERSESQRALLRPGGRAERGRRGRRKRGMRRSWRKKWRRKARRRRSLGRNRRGGGEVGEDEAEKERGRR